MLIDQILNAYLITIIGRLLSMTSYCADFWMQPQPSNQNKLITLI